MGKECIFCGKDISHKREKAKYCDTKCKNDFRNNIAKQKRKENIKERSCLHCGKDITGTYYTRIFCSNQCKIDHNTIKDIKESSERYSDSYYYVECEICGKRMRSLNTHLVSKHNTTVKEYKDEFPDALSSSKHNSKESSERVKGEKNPAYNHQGTLSPFSKKSIYHSEETRLETIKKASENRDYTNRISYWLDKGYSEDDATAMLHERQQTFSLDICIQKYGDEEGIRIWQERQEKWQDTLNSKSPEEIERINMAKSTGRMNQLFNGNPEVKNVPGILYFIRFFNSDIEFWKVDITSKTVEKRFPKNRLLSFNNLEYEILEEVTGMSFYECFKEEQDILNKYKDSRIIINYNGFQTTEAFSENVWQNLRMN